MNKALLLICAGAAVFGVGRGVASYQQAQSVARWSQIRRNSAIVCVEKLANGHYNECRDIRMMEGPR